MIQWATNRENDDNREKNANDISPWDQELLKTDPSSFSDMKLFCFRQLLPSLTGSQLLRYKLRGLLDVFCKSVANTIKKKSPDGIPRTFNINHDYTSQEVIRSLVSSVRKRRTPAHLIPGGTNQKRKGMVCGEMKQSDDTLRTSVPQLACTCICRIYFLHISSHSCQHPITSCSFPRQMDGWSLLCASNDSKRNPHITSD